MKAFEGKAWTKFIAVIAKIVTVALKVPPNGIPELDLRSWRQASPKRVTTTTSFIVLLIQKV